jgi:hypothetical protein
VVVAPGAGETDQPRGGQVRRGELAEPRDGLHLGEPGRKIERAAEAHLRGHGREQRVDALRADSAEHRFSLLAGDRRYASLSTNAW